MQWRFRRSALAFWGKMRYFLNEVPPSNFVLSSSLHMGEKCLKQTCIVAELSILLLKMYIGETGSIVYSAEHLVPNCLKRHLLKMKSLFSIPCISVTE